MPDSVDIPGPPTGNDERPTGSPGAGALRSGYRPRPPHAVLFDFHGTLAQVEDPVTWVTGAAAACGVQLEPARATALADRFVAAGRPGAGPPTRVPIPLMEVWANRDLYEYAHREAFTGLAATVDSGIDGLPEALYERVLQPTGWWAYEETVPTLAALHAAGILVAVVSNIGFDIRPIATALGFECFVDAWVLSYEYGRTKPDPAIFTYACRQLGVSPERTLMVGDTPNDAGAVRAGCRAYLLPEAPPGTANGLSAVLQLVGRSAAA